MRSAPERKETESTFSNILHEVISNPDYLAGSEPEGSGWDFSNWPSNNFKEFNGWVVAEKFFGLLTIDNRILNLTIIQTDPNQFSVSDAKISFVIRPLKAKGFPTILVGKDSLDNEVILCNSRGPLEMFEIPECFQDLAQEVGVLTKNRITNNEQGNEWALFLKSVLEAKKVVPDHFGPSEILVRDQLEMGPNETITEKDMLLAEMLIAEQELLMIAFADYILTPNN